MSLAYLESDASPNHPDDIWALKWTSTNSLISGCADGHIRVYDAGEPSTGTVHDLAAHPLAVSALSVSRDGRKGLSASLDGTLVLTHLREGRVLGRIETGREKVDGQEVGAYSCALHPEASAYAYAGRSSKVVIGSISPGAGAFGDENGDATREEIGAENSQQAETSTGRGPLEGGAKVVETGKGKFAMDLQFSPDGRQLAVATERGDVVVLDSETQNIVATYQSHAMPVRTLSWSHDSQWLYTGSDDTRIVLHDVRAGSSTGAGGKGEGAVAILQGHQSWVLSVAAGPDGRLLGSAGADKNVKLWDIGQRSAVYTNTLAAPVWAFDWQPADVQIGSLGVGKQFVVGGDERKVQVYRAAGSV